MNISRNNYECFFLDFIEGNLTPEEEKVLSAFLLENPDLAAELEEVKASMERLAEIPEDSFQFKELIKKDQQSHEADIILAKELEGEAKTYELSKLQSLISHEEADIRRKLLQKTILHPGTEPYTLKNKTRIEDCVQLTNDDFLLIALLENDLSEEEQKHVQQRLKKEPELAYRNEIISKLLLRSPDIFYALKSHLHQGNSTSIAAHELLAIRFLEEGLSREETKELKALGENNENILRAINLLKLTRLQAGFETYSNKAALYRKESRVIPFGRKAFYYTSAAAAILALMITNSRTGGSQEADLASTPFIGPSFNVPSTNVTNVRDSGNPSNPASSNSNPDNAYSTQFSSAEYNKRSQKSDPAQELIASETGAHESTPEANPTRLNSRPLTPFESSKPGDLAYGTPDMQVIYSLPETNNYTAAATESVDLLDYLSKRAMSRLEQTYAYSLAEKKLEKLEESTRKEVELDVKKETDKERIHIKLGPIEYSASRREQRTTFIDRAYGLYKKVSGK